MDGAQERPGEGAPGASERSSKSLTRLTGANGKKNPPGAMARGGSPGTSVARPAYGTQLAEPPALDITVTLAGLVATLLTRMKYRLMLGCQVMLP